MVVFCVTVDVPSHIEMVKSGGVFLCDSGCTKPYWDLKEWWCVLCDSGRTKPWSDGKVCTV